MDFLYNIVRAFNVVAYLRGPKAKSLDVQAAEAAAALGQTEPADAIIVGSGLAGLSAALTLLDRGATVVVIEKEHTMGGNSNKASSGMNACDTSDDVKNVFKSDVIKSAGDLVREPFIDILVDNSFKAKSWLEKRVGVDLSQSVQLGGHQVQRTHRPKNGAVGAELIYHLSKAVKQFAKRGSVKIMTDTVVTEIVQRESDDHVIGVEVRGVNDQEEYQLTATNVVLATGGFAADRSTGSLLDQYRPELMNMSTTAGAFSTGDGVNLGVDLGADVIDMDKVQLHPTGWVDPNDPHNRTKVLAAELMRGVGGVLINDEGKRFCNELGTRAYVAGKMLEH
eukprot:Selendium_serpulae@DN10220_c0_g1_i1.p1